MWCDISGEAAGEIWNWSLLGVKGLKSSMLNSFSTASQHNVSVTEVKHSTLISTASICTLGNQSGFSRMGIHMSSSSPALWPPRHFHAATTVSVFPKPALSKNNLEFCTGGALNNRMECKFYVSSLFCIFPVELYSLCWLISTFFRHTYSVHITPEKDRHWFGDLLVTTFAKFKDRIYSISFPRVINFKFPLQPHQKCFHHTVWRTWLFITSSDTNSRYLTFVTGAFLHCPLLDWG